MAARTDFASTKSGLAEFPSLCCETRQTELDLE